MEKQSTKLILPQLTSELTPVQKGWIKLSNDKESLFGDLEKKELAIQAKIKKAKNYLEDAKDTVEAKADKLKKAQELIKEINASYQEMKEQRLAFTSLITERIIGKSMEYEKRTLDLINEIKTTETTFRIAVNKLENVGKELETEKANFKAHVQNENFRIAAAYRRDLEILVLSSYKEALKQKQLVETIKDYKNSIKDFLANVKLEKFNAFDLKLLSKAEAGKIFKTILKYDGDKDLQDAIASLDDTFAMYEEDLASSETAIQATEERASNVKQLAEEDIITQSTINNLSAAASVTVSEGTAKVSVTLEVVEDNTVEWAIAVVGSFVQHLPQLTKYIRVTAWSKMSIGQMAKALGKYASAKNNIRFNNLILKEVTK